MVFSTNAQKIYNKSVLLTKKVPAYVKKEKNITINVQTGCYISSMAFKKP
jgi:hypothetical protein